VPLYAAARSGTTTVHRRLPRCVGAWVARFGHESGRTEDKTDVKLFVRGSEVACDVQSVLISNEDVA
jgi:hypothetical protein